MIICARKPAPRRSLINTRQAEVKPKAAWYSVKPNAAPTTSNNTWREPTVFCKNAAPSNSKIKATSGANDLRSGAIDRERLIKNLGLFDLKVCEGGQYKHLKV